MGRRSWSADRARAACREWRRRRWPRRPCRRDGLGVVLLHQRVHVGEGLQAVADLALVLRRLRPDLALHHAAHNGADGEEENEGEKCPAGAGSHMREEPPDSNCDWRREGASQGSLGLKYTTGLFDADRRTSGSRTGVHNSRLLLVGSISDPCEPASIRVSALPRNRFAAIRAFTMTSMLQVERVLPPALCQPMTLRLLRIPAAFVLVTALLAVPLWRKRVPPRRQARTAAQRSRTSSPASTTRSSRSPTTTAP